MTRSPITSPGRPAFVPSRLQLTLTDRTLFFGLETVRVALGGLDAEAVLKRVEDGDLRWVFDIGLGARRSELKFWAREILAPETVNLPLTEVIASILGQEETVQRSSIEQRWSLSHVTVGRWIRAQKVKLVAPGKISRASLEKFLKNRWAGHRSPAAAAPPAKSALLSKKHRKTQKP